jgi:hypothetical protein
MPPDRLSQFHATKISIARAQYATLWLLFPHATRIDKMKGYLEIVSSQWDQTLSRLKALVEK